MTEEQLLKRLGEDLFEWEFLGEIANPPELLDAPYEALAGKRGPVFWSCFNPNGMCFFVAEPGPKAVPWNPLEYEAQRERILAKVESLGGRVSVHESWISVKRVDGHHITSAGSSPPTPKQICEAALEAISTESLGGFS